MQLQLQFNDYQKVKKEIKEIKQEYKDILAQNDEYQTLLTEIKVLTEKKKQHELSAQADLGTRWDRLEELKREEKDLKQIISDLAFNELVENKKVEVKDEYDNEFEPNLSVIFKKK